MSECQHIERMVYGNRRFERHVCVACGACIEDLEREAELAQLRQQVADMANCSNCGELRSDETGDTWCRVNLHSDKCDGKSHWEWCGKEGER